MPGNHGLATACRAVADSAGFLAIVVLLFYLVDPNPVKNGSIWGRCTRCTEHALCSIAVELFSLRLL